MALQVLEALRGLAVLRALAIDRPARIGLTDLARFAKQAEQLRVPQTCASSFIICFWL